MLKVFREEARAHGLKDSGAEDYIRARINESSTKFYYQVPFDLSYEQCAVVDFQVQR